MWKQATVSFGVTVSMRLWNHCHGSGVKHKLLCVDIFDWVANQGTVSLGGEVYIHTVYSVR